jgi:acyl dehydratase
MGKELYFEDVNVGDELPPLVKEPITKAQIVRYAGASGDFNALHFDDEVGKNAGMGGIIAHGMLIMGFAGQAVAQWFPRKYLRGFGARFVGMSRVGEEVTVKGTVTQKGQENGENIVSGNLEVLGQDGSVKINGDFKVTLPHKA